MPRGNNDREMDWRDRRPRSGRSHGDREDQGSSSRRRRDAAPRDEEPPRVDVEPPRRPRAQEIPARRTRMRLAVSSDEDEPAQAFHVSRRRARNGGSASGGRRNGNPPDVMTIEGEELVNHVSSETPSPTEAPVKKKGKNASSGGGARDNESTGLSPEGSSKLAHPTKARKDESVILMPRPLPGISIKPNSSATSEGGTSTRAQVAVCEDKNTQPTQTSGLPSLAHLPLCTDDAARDAQAPDGVGTIQIRAPSSAVTVAPLAAASMSLAPAHVRPCSSC
ncbi:hypothetical protein PVAP13_9KG042915 [Panicum virgatum]|uniref:Uncharacterized protein n=1 Tax=Panicum virgatum TaxID=38727 RepID=A0A8T0N8P8_PANVG|nr:hypothetical protein PVAP13_9KG042915 [Panicum virgatum]